MHLLQKKKHTVIRLTVKIRKLFYSKKKELAATPKLHLSFLYAISHLRREKLPCVDRMPKPLCALAN